MDCLQSKMDCLQSKMDCLQSICTPSPQPNTCASLLLPPRPRPPRPPRPHLPRRASTVYGKIKNDTTSRMGHAVADKRVY